MDCPEGLQHEQGECLLLEKTIYGLCQSALAFYRKAKKELGKLGFTPSPIDPCLFMRTNELGTAMIGVYVDDL